MSVCLSIPFLSVNYSISPCVKIWIYSPEETGYFQVPKGKMHPVSVVALQLKPGERRLAIAAGYLGLSKNLLLLDYGHV